KDSTLSGSSIWPTGRRSCAKLKLGGIANTRRMLRAMTISAGENVLCRGMLSRILVRAAFIHPHPLIIKIWQTILFGRHFAIAYQIFNRNNLEVFGDAVQLVALLIENIANHPQYLRNGMRIRSFGSLVPTCPAGRFESRYIVGGHMPLKDPSGES